MGKKKKKEFALDHEKVIFEMMQELMKTQAKVNALVAMVNLLIKKEGRPEIDYNMFLKMFLNGSKEEYDRLLVEHPWFEEYWREQLGGIIDFTR